MNILTKITSRRGANSLPFLLLGKRIETTTTSYQAVARRKSTLTQVFSDKAVHPTTCIYSQAIKANGFIFLSAQLPADKQNKLVSGSVAEQAHVMIQNASHILQAAGSDLDKVVKVNLFVKDFAMVDEVDGVYGGYFPQRPARTTGQVVFLPENADMMMDLVAVVEGEDK